MSPLLNLPFSKGSKPTIYLHLGINKTGTSAIQSYFSQHRDELSKLGVLYPKTGLIGNAHYSLSASLGFCNKTVPAKWVKDVNGLKKSFNKEIRAHSGPVVFSSEDFSLDRAIEPVLEFFDGFDVKVIVYLRRHDHWWLSAYAQAVKMKRSPPWPRGVKSFISFNKRKNRQHGNYRNLLDRWASHLGKENILVRPYESEQNQPNLIIDFLKTVGCENGLSSLPQTVGSINHSLPLKAVQFLDIFQRVETSDENYARLMNYAKSLDSDLNVHSLLPPKFQLKLIQENLEDYEYIAREYMGREDGQLFYEALPDPDVTWKSPALPTMVEVAEAVIKALK